MTSKFLGAVVAAGCVAAAGVGGYVAVRTSPTGSAAGLPAGTSVSQQAPPDSQAAQGTQDTAPSGGPSELEDTQTSVPRGASTSRVPVRKAIPSTTSAPPQVVQQETLPEQARAQSSGAPTETPTASSSEANDANSTGSGQATSPAANARPLFDEIAVPSEAVIGIRLDTAVSSEVSQVEDRVTGRVTRDVIVEGRTVIPAGTHVAGNVTMVQRGGKLRERSRVGVRFTTLLTSDESRIGIQTEAIFRDGEGPGGEATAKIGASAVVGSILGGVFGGKKGAVIGGAAGAAGGTAVVMKGDRNEASLPAGTPLTLRLSAPVTLRLERIAQ